MSAKVPVETATGLSQLVLPVLAPLHLLVYSTLLGTELYQTFVMTKVCYQALPRTAFTTLQKKVFPIYFQGQTLLIVLATATVPPYGVLSLMKSSADWGPFFVAIMTAGLNVLVYGPGTMQAMIARIHQETRDAKLQPISGASNGFGEEMKVLNRAFSRKHAMSIHLNLVTIGATLWYGWRLASRLEFNVR